MRKIQKSSGKICANLENSGKICANIESSDKTIESSDTCAQIQKVQVKYRKI